MSFDRVEYYKEYRLKNKDKIQQKQKEYRLKNKNKIQQKKKKYYEKNKNSLKEKTKKWKQDNKKKSKEYMKNYFKQYAKNNKDTIKQYQRDRRKNNIIYRLNHNLSCSISHSLRLNHLSKNKSHWENIVGYTIQDLKEHLENSFLPDMSWDNYGKWHIDHIIPKTFFQYKSTNDVEFKYCWSLYNLQPLWAIDNFIKGSRYYLINHF